MVGGARAQTDCDQVTYTDPPNQYPFTTTLATAVVQGSPSFTTPGTPFDCTHFATSGSGGELATGMSLTDPNGTGIGAGPRPFSLRLSE
jgi:hypothetical protein